jgi:DNA polymerase-1
MIALDTETTSTDPMLADLVGISLACEKGTGYYIPVGHSTGEPQLALAEVIRALTPTLTDPRIPKAGHNLEYDAIVLAHKGADRCPAGHRHQIAPG